jgi:ABC-type sugar transport system ATPase subunit
VPTIRLHNVTQSYPAERSDAAKQYGKVIGLAAEYASRSTSNNYRHALQSSSPAPPTVRANALDGITLEIKDGELLGAIGPSGCGKTSLLKVISGLLEPDSGTVYYNDQDMTGVLPGDRGIGIVFQDYALYPHMKSAGNIGFFFRVHDRASEIPERVRQVSEIMGVGFEALLSRKPPTLSGGERQRVALARCLARDPHVFLFDEPLSNLDAKLRVQTRIELKRIISRFKATGLYVTHDQTEAIALCDRIAILREGRVEQIGTYQTLTERPLNTFVAGFIGLPPMNLLEGFWTETGWRGAEFSLTFPESRRHPEGRRGIVGVHAQHLRLDPHSAWRGVVTMIEPLIAERSLLVYIETGKVTVALRTPNDTDIRKGDRVALGIDLDQVHLFDGVNGRRLD